MQVRQIQIRQPQARWAAEDLVALQPQCVLVFGAVRFFESPAFLAQLAQTFPDALRLGCSTAGELTRNGVDEGSCTLTAIRFDHTPLRYAEADAPTMDDADRAGQQIGLELAAPDLKGVWVFGPGVAFNGSALVRGLQARIGTGVPISGGLAGDGGAFSGTWTLGPSGVSRRRVVALGLCGDAVRLGHGSFGGWTPFGPSRRITRSQGNVLFELDGEPALAVYKRYLGDYAADLPGSGLLFPFEMGGEGGSRGLIRTILGVDEAQGALILAGEIDAGGTLRLMQASTDRLVSGAEDAASAALGADGGSPALALLVSCVGRKLVMGERVDEEVEAVADVLGRQATLTGFYSNGEICPSGRDGTCGLHNQTMTVTTLSEA